MFRPLWTALLVAAAWSGLAVRAQALPFEPGEHLRMSVSYMHMGIGDVDMSVGETLEAGVRLWPLEVRAKTRGFFNAIHSVDDRYVAKFDPVTRHTVGTEYDQKVGGGRVQELTRYEGSSALIHKITPKGAWDKVEQMQPGAMDIVSAIYVLRTQNLQAGDVQLPIYNNNRSWTMTAHLAGRETMKTDAGEFDTIVVKCAAQFGGDFHNQSTMTVWFSNDERRLPVKIESEYGVGTMRAELTSFSRGQLAQR